MKENLLLLDEMIYLSYYLIKLIQSFILNHNYDKKYPIIHIKCDWATLVIAVAILVSLLGY